MYAYEYNLRDIEQLTAVYGIQATVQADWNGSTLKHINMLAVASPDSAWLEIKGSEFRVPNEGAYIFFEYLNS